MQGVKKVRQMWLQWFLSWDNKKREDWEHSTSIGNAAGTQEHNAGSGKSETIQDIQFK